MAETGKKIQSGWASLWSAVFNVSVIGMLACCLASAYVALRLSDNAAEIFYTPMFCFLGGILLAVFWLAAYECGQKFSEQQKEPPRHG